MVRLLAPLLAFTSNEIWQAMPHTKGADARHVMLNDMPECDSARRLSAEAELKWDNLMRIRDDVNKALELARAEKLIGKPLDAKVTVSVSEEARAAWDSVKDAQRGQSSGCSLSEPTPALCFQQRSHFSPRAWSTSTRTPLRRVSAAWS